MRKAQIRWLSKYCCRGGTEKGATRCTFRGTTSRTTSALRKEEGRPGFYGRMLVLGLCSTGSDNVGMPPYVPLTPLGRHIRTSFTTHLIGCRVVNNVRRTFIQKGERESSSGCLPALVDPLDLLQRSVKKPSARSQCLPTVACHTLTGEPSLQFSEEGKNTSVSFQCTVRYSIAAVSKR